MPLAIEECGNHRDHELLHPDRLMGLLLAGLVGHDGINEGLHTIGVGVVSTNIGSSLNSKMVAVVVVGEKEFDKFMEAVPIPGSPGGDIGVDVLEPLDAGMDKEPATADGFRDAV